MYHVPIPATSDFHLTSKFILAWLFPLHHYSLSPNVISLDKFSIIPIVKSRSPLPIFLPLNQGSLIFLVALFHSLKFLLSYYFLSLFSLFSH